MAIIPFDLKLFIETEDGHMIAVERINFSEGYGRVFDRSGAMSLHGPGRLVVYREVKEVMAVNIKYDICGSDLYFKRRQ